jgi:hypothetical protein
MRRTIIRPYRKASACIESMRASSNAKAAGSKHAAEGDFLRHPEDKRDTLPRAPRCRCTTRVSPLPTLRTVAQTVVCYRLPRSCWGVLVVPEMGANAEDPRAARADSGECGQ